MTSKQLCVTALLAAFALSPTALAGDADAGREKSKVCAGCHGPDGTSVNPEWPNLAGQHQKYLVKSTKAYRDGVRKDDSMSPMVATLSDEDIEDIAAFFASQKPQ